MNFELHSDYKPTGDQPQAIKELVEGFKGTQELKFEMYLWLEGTDANCTSANSVNVDDITITVKFNYPAA